MRNDNLCLMEGRDTLQECKWIDNVREDPVISIVDDDRSMRDGTMRLVRSRGYTAFAFRSGQEFLESEQLAKTSCLITDLQMPVMNGVQLQERLRARNHSIPIIFITAYPDDSIRAQVLARGAICFLTKPFIGETLLSCIDMALKRDLR